MTDAAERKIRTPEQRRAEAAWEVAQTLEKGKYDEFSNLCKKTVSRILNSGLMQALAFLNEKEKGEKNQNQPVLYAFNNQVHSGGIFAFVQGNEDSLLERLLQNADGGTLRRAQVDALAYLEWLARLSKGKAVKEGD